MDILVGCAFFQEKPTTSRCSAPEAVVKSQTLKKKKKTVSAILPTLEYILRTKELSFSDPLQGNKNVCYRFFYLLG
jgi:hypothetical protein